METHESEKEDDTADGTLEPAQDNNDLESDSLEIEPETKCIDSSTPTKLSGDAIKRIVVGLVLLGVIVFVIVDYFTTGYVRSAFESFLAWFEKNPTTGVFAYMGVSFAATVLFLPGSILTLGAGFVFANAFGLGFGVALATVAVFFGAAAGAIVSFLMGRYLLRNWVETLTKKYPVFEAVDKALEEKGFRIMVLLHLSPIVPFNAINYIGGVTAMSLLHYSLSLFAILPVLIVYVFLGATAGYMTDSSTSGTSSTRQIVIIVVGASVGLIGVGFTTYYAKQELRKITEVREVEEITVPSDHIETEEQAVCHIETKNVEGGKKECMFCKHPQFLG